MRRPELGLVREVEAVRAGSASLTVTLFQGARFHRIDHNVAVGESTATAARCAATSAFGVRRALSDRGAAFLVFLDRRENVVRQLYRCLEDYS